MSKTENAEYEGAAWIHIATEHVQPEHGRLNKKLGHLGDAAPNPGCCRPDNANLLAGSSP